VLVPEEKPDNDPHRLITDVAVVFRLPDPLLSCERIEVLCGWANRALDLLPPADPDRVRPLNLLLPLHTE
jgi:hypothetical protein